MTAAPGNLRVEGRKSLFVQATLHCAEGFCAAKIRNISADGALIEADNIPKRGTPVELRRGSQVVVGTIVWRRTGKAGIEFVAPTDVGQWMPQAASKGRGDGLQVFKNPAVGFAAPAPMVRVSTRDMEVVAEMLDDLGAVFAKDAGVTHNYAPQLQAIPIAAQLLRKLAAQAWVRGD